jgi:transcriptional regulator EpsA
VNQPFRLDEDDRVRFADAVEASLDVMSRQQFFVWSQSSLQSLIPHEILICGIDEGTSHGMSIHRFSASRYFRQEHFDRVSDPISGLMPRLLAASEATRANTIFCPEESGRDDDPELLALVIDNEMKNMAAQLLMGVRGKCESYYVFARLSVPLDQRLGRLIDLLLPHLNNAFLRVLSTERDSGAATVSGQRGPLAVTPRQLQILNLIKAGKTNHQIAEMLGCSPWTIKNHIQAILRKLGSNTRTHAITRAMSLGVLTAD